MTRHRKIDEDPWDENDEALSADHVVERLFSRHERHPDDHVKRQRHGARPKRRQGRATDSDASSNA
jgi:hypothetical protein